MKKFRFLFLFLFAFSLGVGSTFLLLRSRPDLIAAVLDVKRQESPLGSALSYAGMPDPFAEMERMQEEMAQGLNEEGGIQMKEDDSSISYEIEGIDSTSLTTKVERGYLSIEGESKKTQGGASIQSSFHRMFSLPPNVDPNKMETLSEKDKVILRFPKTKR